MASTATGKPISDLYADSSKTVWFTGPSSVTSKPLKVTSVPPPPDGWQLMSIQGSIERIREPLSALFPLDCPWRS